MSDEEKVTDVEFTETSEPTEKEEEELAESAEGTTIKDGVVGDETPKEKGETTEPTPETLNVNADESVNTGDHFGN